MHTNVVHVCIQMPMRACTTLYTLILITSILCNAAGYAYTDPAVLYQLASNRETLSVSGSISVQLQQIPSWVQQGLVIGNKLILPRFIFNGEEERRREEYKVRRDGETRRREQETCCALLSTRLHFGGCQHMPHSKTTVRGAFQLHTRVQQQRGLTTVEL